MMKSSMFAKEDSALQRIKVVKKQKNGLNSEQPNGKSSINLAEAYEHEKALAQNYREKNQKNIIKCKFLYNKLTAIGSLQGIPDMIASEVSEVDFRIKQLEQSIYFKKSQQMKRLKRKVGTFLQQINFQVQAQDLDKIEDQIEIILFLMDIFQQKFNQMMKQRKQVDEIIFRLEKESGIHPEHEINKQKQEMANKIKKLEMQIQQFKAKQKLNRIQSTPPRLLSSIISQGNNDNYQQFQQMITSKDIEIQRNYKIIQELQNQINQVKARLQLSENDLSRSRKQEARWKERYRIMQRQKDQRIRLLDSSVFKSMTKSITK